MANLSGLGQFAGGLAQGISNGRQAAIQQAYLKMMMQRQQIPMDHQAWQEDRLAKQDLARPLEQLANKSPRQAGAIGPALEGIYNPEGAKYQPTLADQTAPAPDPMFLERPEEQPVTGPSAVVPLIANAYAQAGKGAQEEYQADQDFKRGMAVDASETRRLLAESLIAHRNKLEEQGDKKIEQGDKKAQAAAEKSKLTPKELSDIQRVMDFRDAAHSALSLVDSPHMPKEGEVRSWLSEQGSRVDATLGLRKPMLGNPDLNTANKFFFQNLYASEYAAGGVRMAASPQMFEQNKKIYANSKYMDHATLRQVAANSVNAADASVENVKSYLRAKGIPEEEWGRYLREPKIRAPEEILGKSQPKTPAQTMGTTLQAPPVPTSTPMQPPPDLFRPGWR